MVTSCSACTSRHKKNCGVSFYSFPQDPELRKKWITAMGREDFVPSSSSRLCSKHFTTDQYQIRPNCNYELLKPDAVPTVFEITVPVKEPPSKKRLRITKTQREQREQRSSAQSSDGDVSETRTSSLQERPPSKKLKGSHSIPNESDPIARQNELLKLACDLLSTNCKQEESNECLDIGKIWGTKLMSLDPMQRKFAEKAINDILFEADLGTLHRNSVQINLNDRTDPLEMS
nr:THAP domain-containing protein 2 isoform X3 [Halyomorpha halys]